jgi:hypothetical protein
MCAQRPGAIAPRSVRPKRIAGAIVTARMASMGSIPMRIAVRNT